VLKKLSTKRTNNLINKWANELNRQLSKEVQMANKYMKKCSAALPIKAVLPLSPSETHFISLGSHHLENKTNAGDTTRGKEPLCTVDGNVNCCNYYGDQYGVSSRN
jgi:hypothetical protein